MAAIFKNLRTEGDVVVHFLTKTTKDTVSDVYRCEPYEDSNLKTLFIKLLREWRFRTKGYYEPQHPENSPYTMPTSSEPSTPELTDYVKES
jgi:hypothetical protein